jgi:choline dehydrogenase-like flavoprotein
VSGTKITSMAGMTNIGGMSKTAQDPLQTTYDVVVVGSGATGGWAAKQCAEAGLKVALLEAGRAVSPKEFTEHMPAYKLKYRDHSPEVVRTRPVQKQCYACMEYN